MKTTTIPRTFEAALVSIAAAKSPEDLFGKFSTDPKKRQATLEMITKVFRKIALLVHPDKNPDAQSRAELAFERLDELRKQAENFCENPQAKEKTATFTPISFKTKKYMYTVTSRLATGGTCDVFSGVVVDRKGAKAPIFVKVPRSATDNDLIKREARAYNSFTQKAKEVAQDVEGVKLAEAYLRHFPTCFDSIELEEPGSPQKKTVTILARHPDFLDGWYSIEAIRKAYSRGVSTRLMAFVWNRVLEGLMFAHSAGILHTALTPNHVIIHAKTHMGNLIDWTASCKIGEKETTPYIDEKYTAFFPPEVLDPKGIPTPETDIYMSAWCMVYLLGGDPVTREIPRSVEAPIAELLNVCLQPQRRLRPHSVEDVYRKFREIARQLWGPPKFIELRMPSQQ